MPAQLFYNVYSIESLKALNWRVIGFVLVAIGLIFLLGMVTVKYCTKDSRKKGVLLQCIFRSNFAIIGIPLAEMLGGTEAVAIAAVISAFSIPLYNILAVISLSIYVEETNGKKTSIKPIAIMAGAMGSDEELAEQLVVWTSLLSMVTLFIIIMLFKGMGLLG